MFFDGPIAVIGQIQQRTNHPYGADLTKGTRALGGGDRMNSAKNARSLNGNNGQSSSGNNATKPAKEGHGQERA